MPLWLLAAFLAAVPARAQAAGAAAVQAPEGLSELDRGLLEQARYQVGRDGRVRTPAPESRLLERPEVLEALWRLRAQQREKALGELERLQDDYLKPALGGRGGALTREQVLRGQLVLAKNWDLLPPEARDGFNALLREAGAKPVVGLDLAWVDKVTRSWDKAVSGALPAADAGPRGSSGAVPLPQSARPPPREEIEARMARVQAATWRDPKSGQLHPYSADVQAGLFEIMRYASADDSAAVLRVLEKRHPLIIRSDAQMLGNADGVAHVPSADDAGEDAVYKLTLPDSYVYAPAPAKGEDMIKVPFVEAPFYKEFGVPPPPLAPYLGEKPVKVTRERQGLMEKFADDSVRFTPAPEAQADVMLHEILHLDTGSEGGGAHALTNEMRSFYAQARFVYNRDEAEGKTAKPGYAQDDDDLGRWVRSPLAFRQKILDTYMSDEVGEVDKDHVLVAQQLALNERALAATGPEFERLRHAELERRVTAMQKARRAVFDYMERNHLLASAQAQAGRDAVDAEFAKLRQSKDYADWDYLAVLQEEHRRLLKDQAMALSNVGEDIEVHRARGIPYAGSRR